MTPHLDPRLVARWEDAAAAERAAALDHAGGCAPCRDLLLTAEPSAAFGLLAAEPMPAWVLAAVSASVETALDGGHDGEHGQRPRAFAPVPRARLAAAWAAAVLLAAALSSLYVLRPQGVSTAVARVEAPNPLAGPGSRPSRPSGPDVPSGVEVMDTPGVVRVLDLTVGDTQVVMIFDEGIEL